MFPSCLFLNLKFETLFFALWIYTCFLWLILIRPWKLIIGQGQNDDRLEESKKKKPVSRSDEGIWKEREINSTKEMFHPSQSDIHTRKKKYLNTIEEVAVLEYLFVTTKPDDVIFSTCCQSLIFLNYFSLFIISSFPRSFSSHTFFFFHQLIQ